MRTLTSPARRPAWTALLVLVALLVHGWVVATRAWPVVRDEAPLIDFATYDAAVAAARAGDDPYDGAALLRHRRAPEPRVLSAFQYPPTFLVALGWTASTSPAEAARRWFWVNEAALLAAAACLVALAPSSALPTALPTALVLAGLGAIPDHLRFGQANALALAAWMLGAVALARWRHRTAGLLFGVAVSVKLMPLVVVLPLVAARRWTAAGWTVLGTALGAALAIVAAPAAGLGSGRIAAATARYWTEVVPALVRGEVRPPFPLDVFPNLSLASVVARHLGEAGELTPGARPLALGLTAALVALVALAARRVSPERAPLAFAALSVWPMLLVPGYVFEHHLVLVLPALVWLAARVLGAGVALGEGELPAPPRGLRLAAVPVLVLSCWAIGDLRARANPPGSTAEALLWDAKTYAWLGAFALVLLDVSRRGPNRSGR